MEINYWSFFCWAWRRETLLLLTIYLLSHTAMENIRCTVLLQMSCALSVCQPQAWLLQKVELIKIPTGVWTCEAHETINWVQAQTPSREGALLGSYLCMPRLACSQYSHKLIRKFARERQQCGFCCHYYSNLLLHKWCTCIVTKHFKKTTATATTLQPRYNAPR